MSRVTAQKADTIPLRENALGMEALPPTLDVHEVHPQRRSRHARYLTDRGNMMRVYYAALSQKDARPAASEARRRILELDGLWKKPIPTQQDIIDAMLEPGCPRALAMLVPEWQRSQAREKWTAFCKDIQSLGEVKSVRPVPNWNNNMPLFRIEGSAHNAVLAFDKSQDGYITGLYSHPIATFRPKVPAASLPEKLAQVVKDYELPGAAALVMDGNQIVSQAAFGVRSLTSPNPVTLSDRWHLGSDTKAMTSVLAGILVDQGEIKWDSTLAEVFPDWAMDEGMRDVTLRMLLNHRSGLPANAAWEDVKPLLSDDPLVEREKIVRMSLRKPPDKKGADRYSNLGYMVAGTMLQRVTGKSWETLMRTQLFEPLGMHSAGFGGPARQGADQPLGHVKSENGGLNPIPAGPGADNRASMGPAGTVHCSLEDWAKFAAIYFKDSKQTLLKPETLATLTTRQFGGGYSFGWGQSDGPIPGEIMLNHTGSNTMYYATAYVSPKTNRVFLFATNVATKKAGEASGEVINYMVDAHDR